MHLTLLITDNCAACERAIKALLKIQLKYPQASVEIIHINDFEAKGISITPALLLNNQLFSYGDIEESKLLPKLKFA